MYIIDNPVYVYIISILPCILAPIFFGDKNLAILIRLSENNYNEQKLYEFSPKLSILFSSRYVLTMHNAPLPIKSK